MTTWKLTLGFWICGGGVLLALGAWDGRTQRIRDACALGCAVLLAGSWVLASVLVARRTR